MTEGERHLPHSMEAEQAVLGGLMLAGEGLFDSVASIIGSEDLFRPEHRVIFSTLARLSDKDEPFDPVTVSENLSGRRELDKAGGAAYVSELAQNAPSSANVEAYARIVRERAMLRQLIGAAGEMVQRGYNPDGAESSQLLAEAEEQLISIADSRPNDRGFQHADELLKETIERIDELSKTDADITGVTTGYDQLNSMTSGWQPSDLIILAARPSMGKTAFALNLVENALFTSDKPILVFSLEMPAQALMMRLLASVGRIELKNVRDGNLSGEEWQRLAKAASRIKGQKLYIDDTPGLTPSELRSRTRRISREHGEPGMIILDYLQLMQVTGASEGRVQELSQITRSLKQVAREYSCPMIALSQLNRGVEQRPNKRPLNSDLRESGSIEQDADVILFIYRDEYYNEESSDKGIAEIIIGKQRNGETGTCRLAFLGQFTRFENLAPDYRQTGDV